MARNKTVLIVGGSGFLGTSLALHLRDRYKVFATYHKNRIIIPGITMIPLGVENRNWVKRVMQTTLPDVVFYLAGKNDVDWAEANPHETEVVHSAGAGNVSNIGDSICQPKFIYVSNAFTFDGARGNYHETDIVLPQTTLGKVKFGGENYIKSKSLNFIILRVSPIFGRGNGYNFSFTDRLRMSLARGKKTELVSSEIHSFAPLDGFLETAAAIIENTAKNRIFHYGGLTKMSFFEFGKIFAKDFGFDPSLIVAKRMTRKKTSTFSNETQFDFSLNSTQIVEQLKIKPLLLEEGLDLLKKKLIDHL